MQDVEAGQRIRALEGKVAELDRRAELVEEDLPRLAELVELVELAARVRALEARLSGKAPLRPPEPESERTRDAVSADLDEVDP